MTQSDAVGAAIILFLIIAAGVIAWWMAGVETLVCRQPKLTEENYIRLKIETAEKGCLFILRDR